MAKIEVVWFAKIPGLREIGPFDSEAGAWESIEHGDDSWNHHPSCAYVWPVRKSRIKMIRDEVCIMPKEKS